MIQQELFNEYIKRYLATEQFYCIDGTVNAIDADNRTIDVMINEDENNIITNVKLQGDFAQTVGICVFPTVGTICTIAMRDAKHATLLKCTQIDKIIIDTDSIIINGGNNGGMVMSPAITTKLNNLENQVNALLTALNTVVITLAPSGEFPISSFFDSLQSLPTTQQSDIENTKITQ